MSSAYISISSDDLNCHWKRDRVLWCIIGMALLLGLIYNVTIMPGFGPDEPRHFNYVKLLFEEHRLPFLLPNGSEYHGAHSFHPPLYYLYLIPFYALGQLFSGDVSWHLMRLGSLLLCVLALPLIYQIGFAAGGKNVARLSTLLVAWLPMWGMTAATINNDSATFFFVVLLLWLLTVRFPNRHDYRSAVVVGVVLGLGTLCKATVLLCGAVAYLLYLWMQTGKTVFKTPKSWQRLGITLAITAIIAGWWHVRSFLLYGSFTPLPPSMPTPFLPDPTMGALILMMHPHFPTVFGYANLKIFETLWTQKDWLLMGAGHAAWQSTVRNGIYWIFGALPLIAAIGYGFQAARNKMQTTQSTLQSSLSAKMAQVLPLVTFAVTWLAVLQVALFWHWGWADGGRYLLPALCGFTIWESRGLKFLCGKLNILTVFIALFLLCVNIIAIYWLWTYLNPTFGVPK